jgi:hypothetical protein
MIVIQWQKPENSSGNSVASALAFATFPFGALTFFAALFLLLSQAGSKRRKFINLFAG